MALRQPHWPLFRLWFDFSHNVIFYHWVWHFYTVAKVKSQHGRSGNQTWKWKMEKTQTSDMLVTVLDCLERQRSEGKKRARKIVCDCCVDAVTFEWVEYLRTAARSLMNSSNHFSQLREQMLKGEKADFFSLHSPALPSFSHPFWSPPAVSRGRLVGLKLGVLGGGGTLKMTHY